MLDKTITKYTVYLRFYATKGRLDYYLVESDHQGAVPCIIEVERNGPISLSQNPLVINKCIVSNYLIKRVDDDDELDQENAFDDNDDTYKGEGVAVTHSHEHRSTRSRGKTIVTQPLTNNTAVTNYLSHLELEPDISSSLKGIHPFTSFGTLVEKDPVHSFKHVEDLIKHNSHDLTWLVNNKLYLSLSNVVLNQTTAPSINLYRDTEELREFMCARTAVFDKLINEDSIATLKDNKDEYTRVYSNRSFYVCVDAMKTFPYISNIRDTAADSCFSCRCQYFDTESASFWYVEECICNNLVDCQHNNGMLCTYTASDGSSITVFDYDVLLQTFSKSLGKFANELSYCILEAKGIVKHKGYTVTHLHNEHTHLIDPSKYLECELTKLTTKGISLSQILDNVEKVYSTSYDIWRQSNVSLNTKKMYDVNYSVKVFKRAFVAPIVEVYMLMGYRSLIKENKVIHPLNVPSLEEMARTVDKLSTAGNADGINSRIVSYLSSCKHLETFSGLTKSTVIPPYHANSPPVVKVVNNLIQLLDQKGLLVACANMTDILGYCFNRYDFSDQTDMADVLMYCLPVLVHILDMSINNMITPYDYGIYQLSHLMIATGVSCLDWSTKTLFFDPERPEELDHSSSLGDIIDGILIHFDTSNLADTPPCSLFTNPSIMVTQSILMERLIQLPNVHIIDNITPTNSRFILRQICHNNSLVVTNRLDLIMVVGSVAEEPFVMPKGSYYTCIDDIHHYTAAVNERYLMNTSNVVVYDPHALTDTQLITIADLVTSFSGLSNRQVLLSLFCYKSLIRTHIDRAILNNGPIFSSCEHTYRDSLFKVYPEVYNSCMVKRITTALCNPTVLAICESIEPLAFASYAENGRVVMKRVDVRNEYPLSLVYPKMSDTMQEVSRYLCIHQSGDQKSNLSNITSTTKMISTKLNIPNGLRNGTNCYINIHDDPSVVKDTLDDLAKIIPKSSIVFTGSTCKESHHILVRSLLKRHDTSMLAPMHVNINSVIESSRLTASKLNLCVLSEGDHNTTLQDVLKVDPVHCESFSDAFGYHEQKEIGVDDTSKHSYEECHSLVFKSCVETGAYRSFESARFLDIEHLQEAVIKKRSILVVVNRCTSLTQLMHIISKGYKKLVFIQLEKYFNTLDMFIDYLISNEIEMHTSPYTIEDPLKASIIITSECGVTKMAKSADHVSCIPHISLEMMKKYILPYCYTIPDSENSEEDQSKADPEADSDDLPQNVTVTDSTRRSTRAKPIKGRTTSAVLQSIENSAILPMPTLSSPEPDTTGDVDDIYDEYNNTNMPEGGIIDDVRDDTIHIIDSDGDVCIDDDDDEYEHQQEEEEELDFGDDIEDVENEVNELMRDGSTDAFDVITKHTSTIDVKNVGSLLAGTADGYLKRLFRFFRCANIGTRSSPDFAVQNALDYISDLKSDAYLNGGIVRIDGRSTHINYYTKQQLAYAIVSLGMNPQHFHNAIQFLQIQTYYNVENSGKTYESNINCDDVLSGSEDEEEEEVYETQDDVDFIDDNTVDSTYTMIYAGGIEEGDEEGEYLEYNEDIPIDEDSD